MICKECHPVFEHQLTQTGAAHPQSYKCVACDAVHDDNGKLYDPDRLEDEDDENLKCPHCGSTEFGIYAYVGMYKCNKCGTFWDMF